jgi:hypothetical protein
MHPACQPGPPAAHAPMSPIGPFPRVRRPRPAPFAPGAAALLLSPARSGPPRFTRPASPAHPGSRSHRLIPVRPPTQAGSVCTRPSPAQLRSQARSGPHPMHQPTARPTRSPRSHESSRPLSVRLPTQSGLGSPASAHWSVRDFEPSLRPGIIGKRKKMKKKVIHLF